MPEDIVSPQDLARLRAANATVQRLKGEGARVLYELGVALREVEEQELWRAGGHGSFTAWLEEAEVARATARRAIEVARHFNADIAARYGFDKLALGLRYLALTDRDEQPGDLIAADLRLRGEHGRFVSVPFHEATVRQLQDAVAELVAGARPRLSGKDDLGARLVKLSKTLPAVPRGLSPAAERVSVARSRSGKVALTFRQIPLDELGAFIAALQALQTETEE